MVQQAQGMVYIRPLIKVRGEFHAAEELSRSVWGPASTDLAHVMIAAAEAGGVVLGAFTPRGRLVGFAQAFPAYDNGQVWLYSHAMAVHPDHRGQGVARLLKWRQREEALRRGFDLVSWTYDPLMSLNAYLNLRRLGVQLVDYGEEYYGPMRDKLNAELPSDRVVCHWHLRSEPVMARLEGRHRPDPLPAREDPCGCGKRSARGEQPSPDDRDAIPGHATRISPPISCYVNWVTFTPAGLPRPIQLAPLTAGCRRAYLLILGYPEPLKDRSLRLALEWRLSVRRNMKELLANGFVGVDYQLARPGDVGLAPAEDGNGGKVATLGVYSFERSEHAKGVAHEDNPS